MATKFCYVVALFAVFFALAGHVVKAHDKLATGVRTFDVQGRVYCDTCRIGFETTATEYIKGAKVRLECRHEDTNEIKHTVEGVTDATGSYRLKVEDDHENEICEVILVDSPNTDCSEIKSGRDRARILLTHNAGICDNIRFANSLGFLKAEPLPTCGTLLMQYQLGDQD